MNYREALDLATKAVLQLKNHTMDILTVKRPRDLQEAIDLSKVVSKLSPIVGNTIEYTITQYLNSQKIWPEGCIWIRQDPDFPDTLLSGMPWPQPGLEIKAWFPLSTEITARFRDSQTLLQEYNTRVVVVCWMPEFIIAGQPKIIDIFVCDALDFAKARDIHYHHPPEYVVMEPEDTSLRTRNLQQKNCNGLGFQGSSEQLREAKALVASWGKEGLAYQTSVEYQNRLRELVGRFPYRLDTNFAKIDRIELPGLEAFKRRILDTVYLDRTVQQWIQIIRASDPAGLKDVIDPTSPPPVH